MQFPIHRANFSSHFIWFYLVCSGLFFLTVLCSFFVVLICFLYTTVSITELDFNLV